jgi:hypothetical protein
MTSFDLWILLIHLVSSIGVMCFAVITLYAPLFQILNKMFVFADEQTINNVTNKSTNIYFIFIAIWGVSGALSQPLLYISILMMAYITNPRKSLILFIIQFTMVRHVIELESLGTLY